MGPFAFCRCALGEVRPALSDLAGANRDPSFSLLVSIDIVVGGEE